MDPKELFRLINKADTQTSEGDYQSSNGAFEGLNPKFGVTLKEFLVNRKENDRVSLGVVKTSEEAPTTKRMSLVQYQNIKTRQPFPINR